MGKHVIKPSAEQTTRPKRTVVVSDGVRVVMAGLSQAEKDAIESAFKSSATLLRLPVEYVVHAQSGDMYTARVTDELRLVYQIQPDRVDVIDLLSAGAVDFLIGPNIVSKPGGESVTKT
ncbi:MAG: hypothetical protein L0241_05395 [Planctomycetia bacterium]|nr:hypothetical protein [Planctomycetia bacterium]